jgi:hypothetical protein
MNFEGLSRNKLKGYDVDKIIKANTKVAEKLQNVANYSLKVKVIFLVFGIPVFSYWKEDEEAVAKYKGRFISGYDGKVYRNRKGDVLKQLADLVSASREVFLTPEQCRVLKYVIKTPLEDV